MNFNLSDIKSNLVSTVGFFDTVNIPLSNVLKTSNSGVYVNDNSIPYLNIDLLKDLFENIRNFNFIEWSSTITYPINFTLKYTFPTWSVAKSYAIGEYVQINNKGYKSLTAANLANNPETDYVNWLQVNEIFAVYKSILSNSNKQPDINVLSWSELDLFSELLENRLSNATVNVLEKATKSDNEILEQNQLFYGLADSTLTIENVTDHTVGLKLRFSKRKNVRAKINKIGFQFTGAVTDLNVSLHCQNVEITSQLLSTDNNNFAWFNLTDFDISSTNGGDYYLSYSQNDLLTEKVINNNTFVAYQQSKYLDFNFFAVPVGADFKTINEENFTPGYSYISNIDYSIFPDITDFLVQNKNIFAQAIKLQFAMDIYNLFITNENKRINSSQRVIDKDYVLLQVTDTEKTNNTLINKFYYEIKNLINSIGKAKIDNVSLPTEKLMFQTFAR